MTEYSREHASTRRPQHKGRYLLLTAMLMGGCLFIAPLAWAAGDQNYKALRDWIEQSRTVPPTFTPGQHLTEADRKALEPFIPQPAWEY
jgi:hypothetical protein